MGVGLIKNADEHIEKLISGIAALDDGERIETWLELKTQEFRMTRRSEYSFGRYAGRRLWVHLIDFYPEPDPAADEWLTRKVLEGRARQWLQAWSEHQWFLGELKYWNEVADAAPDDLKARFRKEFIPEARHHWLWLRQSYDLLRWRELDRCENLKSQGMIEELFI